VKQMAEQAEQEETCRPVPAAIDDGFMPAATLKEADEVLEATEARSMGPSLDGPGRSRAATAVEAPHRVKRGDAIQAKLAQALKPYTRPRSSTEFKVEQKTAEDAQKSMQSAKNNPEALRLLFRAKFDELDESGTNSLTVPEVEYLSRWVYEFTSFTPSEQRLREQQVAIEVSELERNAEDEIEFEALEKYLEANYLGAASKFLPRSRAASGASESSGGSESPLQRAGKPAIDKVRENEAELEKAPVSPSPDPKNDGRQAIGLQAMCEGYSRPAQWDEVVANLDAFVQAKFSGDRGLAEELEMSLVMNDVAVEYIPYAEVFKALDSNNSRTVTTQEITENFAKAVVNVGLSSEINKDRIQDQFTELPKSGEYNLDEFLVLMAVCQQRWQACMDVAERVLSPRS